MVRVIWYSFTEKESSSREKSVMTIVSRSQRTHKNGATETVGRAIWERARRRWEKTPPDRQRSGSQLWGQLIGLEYGEKVSRASVHLSVTRVLNRRNCWGSCNSKQLEDVWGASANYRRKPNTTVHHTYCKINFSLLVISNLYS